MKKYFAGPKGLPLLGNMLDLAGDSTGIVVTCKRSFETIILQHRWSSGVRKRRRPAPRAMECSAWLCSDEWWRSHSMERLLRYRCFLTISKQQQQQHDSVNLRVYRGTYEGEGLWLPASMDGKGNCLRVSFDLWSCKFEKKTRAELFIAKQKLSFLQSTLSFIVWFLQAPVVEFFCFLALSAPYVILITIVSNPWNQPENNPAKRYQCDIICRRKRLHHVFD